MVLVGLGVPGREFLISVNWIGVVRVIVFIYILFFFDLHFSRIDSVYTTVEIGVSACDPDSFRDCPSATVTSPSILMWANTSQYVDTESSSPNRSP